MSKRSIPGLKDAQGAYLPIPPQTPQDVPETVEETGPRGSLDDILKRQLLALERLTNQLLVSISHGNIKDTPQQLSTLIKVTLELKAREKDILDDLSDEELEAAGGE